MSTPNSTPSKKVSFYSHFPHYFLKPYAAQPKYETLPEFMSKLSPKNCEWLLRPEIAMSEAAQAILENKAILEQSNIFGDNLGTDCLDAVNTVTAELQKMNTNDKTSFADGDDLYRLMSFFMGTDDTFNSYLKEAMQAGAAMYVFAAQITAMQSMFLHPEAYATKLNSDDPACIAFKTTQTVGALQQMLKTLCCKVPAPAAQSVARNLQAQLDPGTIGLSRAATEHMTPHLPPSMQLTPPTHPQQQTLPPPRTQPPVHIQPIPSVTPPPAQPQQAIPTAMMDVLLKMQAEMQSFREIATTLKPLADAHSQSQVTTQAIIHPPPTTPTTDALTPTKPTSSRKRKAPPLPAHLFTDEENDSDSSADSELSGSILAPTTKTETKTKKTKKSGLQAVIEDELAMEVERKVLLQKEKDKKKAVAEKTNTKQAKSKKEK